jgi:AI-2 transport protein TqsA
MKELSGRLVIYLVGAACIFVILFGIRASAYIINPILLAIVITITVLPIPGRLTQRGLPGWLSLVLTILMVVLVLALVIMTAFFSITGLAGQLPQYIATDTQPPSGSDPGTAGISNTMSAVALFLQTNQVSQNILGNLLDLLVQFGWALVIFFFMISAAISLPTPSRLGLDPDTPSIAYVTRLTEDVRKYLGVLTGINFLVGLGDTILLLILGVDYAVLWGLLAWFMGYIPSIGFIIALIPPVVLAYFQYGLQTALVVLVGFILINGGVQNFIQPKIMGQRLSISPVVVFIGLFVWGYLLGGIGAILAVPLTMLVLIIMENFEGTRTLAVLMRYTGEEGKEERQEAVTSLKGTFNKLRKTLQDDQ